jgi:hypothetical protein
MSKVNRGEKILNRLVTEQKITSCGRDWLIAALDPFHDSQLDNLEGWPDMECGASVVRCVKKSTSVTVPTALAGQNWDCHIAMHPTLMVGGNNAAGGPWENDVVQDNHIFAITPATTTGTCKVGGLQIVGCKAGITSSYNESVVVGSENILMANIEIGSDFTTGSGRLIGIGFEVHNTTAELYKQGSVIVYRMQAENRDPVDFQITTATGAGNAFPAIGSVSCQQLRRPPMTAEEAMLLQGSRQWEAAEGCYVVGAFSSEENPAFGISQTIPIMNVNAIESIEGVANNFNVYAPRIQRTVASFAGLAAPYQNFWTPTYAPIRVHPIHQSGAIFSGLSPQTSLTVNINFFYESFPGPSDQQILVLAKPSCKYDPSVMELYSRLIQELPVGVPVAENGLGDWFLDAASKAAKYIGPVLAALPHPIAKGAGAALTYLGETGQDYVKRQQKEFIQPPNAWESESGIGSQSPQYNQLNKRVKKIAKQEKKIKKKIKRTAPKNAR